MMPSFSLAALTVLELAPPALIDVAAACGFPDPPPTPACDDGAQLVLQHDDAVTLPPGVSFLVDVPGDETNRARIECFRRVRDLGTGRPIHVGAAQQSHFDSTVWAQRQRARIDGDRKAR